MKKPEHSDSYWSVNMGYMSKCCSCGKTLGLDGDGFSLSKKTNNEMMCDTCYQKKYGIFPPIIGPYLSKKEDADSKERGVVSFD